MNTPKELRIYGIDSNKFDGKIFELSNNDFMTIAEEQGLVWSKQGFESSFNSEEVGYNVFIRFIEVDAPSLEPKPTTPSNREWIATFYGKDDKIIKTINYSDRTEGEAKSESESYAENNSDVEDWSLMPSTTPIEGSEKFTQGEWRFEKHDPKISRYFGNILSDLGKGDDGIMNIRTIDIVLKNCGEEEAEANARLIASSPAMYRLLNKIEPLLLDGDAGKLTNFLVDEVKPLLSYINKQ